MDEKKKKQRSPEEQAKIDRMLEGLRKKREADKLAKEQKKAQKEKHVEPVVANNVVATPVAPPNSLIETPLVSNKSKEEKTERWNKLYTKLDEIEKSVKSVKKSKTKKIIMEDSSSDEEVIVVKKNYGNKLKPAKEPEIKEPEVVPYIEKPVIKPSVIQRQAIPEPVVGSSEWLRKHLFGQ